MKIPKVFILENLKEEDTNSLKKSNNKKKSILNLDDLVPDIFNNETKYITSAHQDFLTARGVDTGIVEKAIWINNRNDNSNYILLIQYKTKIGLITNLKDLFEKGTIFYHENAVTFSKRFLFMDNISIYLQVKEEFIKECIKYYRKLGFKQLDYELKMV